MKFILLNGSSCSGKSTVIKKIMSEKERYYQLSYDSHKWLFSHYKPDTHFADVRKLILSISEAVCEMKYDIVCDSALYRETREKLLEIPKRHGYEIVEINFATEYEILAKRFDERVKSALQTPGAKISNTSKERFRELFEIHQREKNPQAITIRTDDRTVDEVIMEVFALL